MEICMIYIWYILCLHWCRLPWFRMEICRWWGKLFHCLSSSVWSVLSKWPPDCSSLVPRSPAATGSSPPLIGRDLVDHSGEEEVVVVVGGMGGGGSALTSYYHTALGTWLCCIAPKCTPLQVLNTLSSLSSKEEMWISFINSCLHVKPWQTTQFSIFVPLVCFFC